MRILLVLAAAFCWLTAPVTRAEAFTLSNFESPDSVLVDPDDGAYFVSNVNGTPLEKDGNGYISKINAAGSIVIQKFIGGKEGEPLLHAPKGMVIAGRNLYVTDIDTVKAFDRKTRKLAALIDLSKFDVRFLNDIVSDDRGNLYVSDTMTDRIFKIDTQSNFETKVYIASPQLAGPNGLSINPRTRNLMAVTWDTGEVLEINHLNRRIHVLKTGLSRLDGIDHDGRGNFYVSSFEKGEIYKISRYGRGVLENFLISLTTPADVSYDRRKDELLIPSFKGGKVATYDALGRPAA